MTLASVETNWNTFAITRSCQRLVFHINPILYPIGILLANLMLTIPTDIVGGAFAINGLKFTITAPILLTFTNAAWIVRCAMVEIGIVYDLILAI